MTNNDDWEPTGGSSSTGWFVGVILAFAVIAVSFLILM